MQVYPQGWQRIRSLMSENPTAAKVYAVLPEHIDPSCGAVVVSQDVLAEMVGVSERTIRRATAYLEVLALVPHTGERIRLCLRTGPERGLARVGLPEGAGRVPDAHPREEERAERAREAQTQMMLREQTGGARAAAGAGFRSRDRGGSGIVRCSNFQNDKFVYSLHKLQRRSASVSVCSLRPAGGYPKPSRLRPETPRPLSPRKENDHALRHLPTREDQDGAGPDRFRQPHDASGGHAER